MVRKSKAKQSVAVEPKRQVEHCGGIAQVWNAKAPHSVEKRSVAKVLHSSDMTCIGKEKQCRDWLGEAIKI